MKKILLILLAISLIIPSTIYAAAGTCTQTAKKYYESRVVITFACTGSSVDGTVPDQPISAANMALIRGTHYLYKISALPTAGGTAPDAADVFVLDANGEDYLGSSDGGTTANKGANLIPAAVPPKSSLPYCYNMASWFYFPVINNLTLRIKNQSTVNANFTVELTFER